MPATEDLPGVTGIRSLPRNVWATIATSFLTDISTEMIFTVMPLFLANVLGAPTAIIGLIEGAAEATSSFLKIASGWLSDRLGRRKWLAVLGYAISACAKPLLLLVTSWPGILVVRVAERVGKGIRTSPRDALIADSVDSRHRGIAFGLHRAGDTAGAMVGLFIALLVVLATQAQAIDLNQSTFMTLVAIGVIPGFLAVLVLSLGVKEMRAARPAVGSATKPRVALDADFKFFLIVMGIFTLGNSSDAFLILRAQERGLSVSGILGMLITFNLIYAVFAGPLGALSDRIGRKRVIIVGWLVYALLYLGFAAASTGTHIWVVFGLYGLYYAAVEGTAKALVADLVPAEKRGTAYGYFHATIGLMALPASLLSGVLWQVISPSAPFVVGAVLALTASVLLALRWRSTLETRRMDRV